MHCSFSLSTQNLKMRTLTCMDHNQLLSNCTLPFSSSTQLWSALSQAAVSSPLRLGQEIEGQCDLKIKPWFILNALPMTAFFMKNNYGAVWYFQEFVVDY